MDSLVSDVEAFVDCVNQLRSTLESKPPGWPIIRDCNLSMLIDGTRCVQVHEALTQVSHSIRDLLVKYPVFKTSQILIPTSQLVHSVKGDLLFTTTEGNLPIYISVFNWGANNLTDFMPSPNFAPYHYVINATQQTSVPGKMWPGRLLRGVISPFGPSASK